MQGKTGVTADTAKRRLLGEGTMWIDYGEAGARKLGAVTQGQWDPGITLAQGAVAGTIGILLGTDYIESCIPTLQATLLEVTTENLKVAFPGGAEVAGTTRAHKSAEWFGLGDGGTTVYPLEEDNVYDGSLSVWWDLGWGPVLLTEGATEDYQVNYATGVVTFNANVPAASAGTSRSAVAPVLDMTAHSGDVNGIVAIDGAAPVAVVYDWTGCTTGALTAAQIQVQLNNAVAGTTCVYVANVPGVSDYYLATSPTTGVTSIVEFTSGVPNDAHVHLKLGVGEGGTETYGNDAANLTADYQYDPQDGAQTHDVITVDAITEADYHKNVAWLGKTADQPVEDLIIIVHNPIATEMAAWTLEEKGNVGVQVTFRGSVTGAAPQTLPFAVRRPLPA